MNWRIVATLTPEHLFAQAERLLLLYPKRRPRQTELRRTISSAYYGVFHFILTKASDMHVGAKYRADPRYTLVYRSISHAWLRTLCLEIVKPTAPALLNPYLPLSGIGPDLRRFALDVASLRDKRHRADYDPSVNFVRRDDASALESARAAVKRFHSSTASERRLFLALLLFPPRGRA